MNKLPKDDLKKQDILSEIAKELKKEREYNEMEVNDIIKSMIDDDHVLIRRELVNFGYLKRDPYKGLYWLITSKLSKEKLDSISDNQKNIKNNECSIDK